MQNILVIGGGSIGERHVRCFQKSGRATVALCEMRDELRESVTQRYDLPASFATLTDALPHSFDAAVVCTPAHLHIPMALDLARHNIGLLIEKPLSMSPDGIDDLRHEVQSRNLPASVAYVLRSHPAMEAIKAFLDTGTFGQPVQVVAVGGQHFPFYRPAYREIYYTKHETGGGAIQDALTHIVNAAEWMVGPITRLVADAEHCLLDGVDVEDTVHMITRHAGRDGTSVLGSFSLNQHQAPNENSLTIICERGTVRCDLHSHRWLTCSEPGANWKVEQQFDMDRDEMFIRQAAAFLDYLEGSAEAACSLQQGQQTLRVNLAALQSAKTNQWVQL
ncbi:MAG: Gfo/Idh/MocA family oxidoreductase [Planctomycetaceae bacterium]